MRYYDELGVFFGTACYVKEKGKLSLWRQGCFGLIEKIYSIRLELILSNGKEAFSMRLFMISVRDPFPFVSIGIICCCNIIKALCSEEISLSCLVISLDHCHCIT